MDTLRASHLSFHAALLVGGVFLFGFGFFDPMLTLFVLALVGSAVIFLPVLSARHARSELAEHDLNVDARKYAAPLRGLALRRRTRRAQGLPRLEHAAVDLGLPALFLVTWVSLLAYLNLALSAQFAA